MKRILAFILTILMFLFAFASCGHNESFEDESESMIEDEEFEGEESDGETETQESDETQSDNEDKKDDEKEDDSKETYTRKENKIAFGSYPQTKVTDKKLLETLEKKAKTLPTPSNKGAWTPYDYYISGKKDTDFMWYIDVTEGEYEYRGVYFTSYRPNYTQYSSSDTNSNQDDNGYLMSSASESHVYWFKYEPISWTILSENKENGTALILCDMIIDSQEYHGEYEYDSNSGKYYNSCEDIAKKIYANNYKYSAVRNWLNETFYKTAFNKLQKELIVETTVNNDAKSTGFATNDYAFYDTNDKVFLLSYQEATNESYGLNDAARQKKTTDYAQSQGSYIIKDENGIGNGYWWLRSPSNEVSYDASFVNNDGSVDYYDVYFVSRGIVPALQIKLK